MELLDILVPRCPHHCPGSETPEARVTRRCACVSLSACTITGNISLQHAITVQHTGWTSATGAETFLRLPFCALQKCGCVDRYWTLSCRQASDFIHVTQNSKAKQKVEESVAGVMTWQWLYSTVLLIWNLFSWHANLSTTRLSLCPSYWSVFTFHRKPTCRRHRACPLTRYCVWSRHTWTP